MIYIFIRLFGFLADGGDRIKGKWRRGRKVSEGAVNCPVRTWW